MPSCKLTTLPPHLLDGIEQPLLVTTVDLSSNLLSALPLSCLRFGSLTRLLLASNLLNPSRALFELFTRHTPQLAELDLSNNCISKWCVTLAFPSALQILKLSNNRLTELPAALASFISLHTLVISNNNLSSLGEHLPHSLLHLGAHISKFLVTAHAVVQKPKAITSRSCRAAVGRLPACRLSSSRTTS